jgi:hypothetical protein
MSHFSAPKTAIAALEMRNFSTVHALPDRDVIRIYMKARDSQRMLCVTDFTFDFNLFDVSHEAFMPCVSLEDEVNLRRALDSLSQDHPFINVSADVVCGEARVTLSVLQQLVGDELERRETAYVLVVALNLAADEFYGVATSSVQEAA